MRVRTLGRYDSATRDRLVLDALPPGEVARREPTSCCSAMVSPTSLAQADERRSADAARRRSPSSTGPLPDGWVRVGMDFRLAAGPVPARC